MNSGPMCETSCLTPSISRNICTVALQPDFGEEERMVVDSIEQKALGYSERLGFGVYGTFWDHHV